jgi:membrane dipeptidase
VPLFLGENEKRSDLQTLLNHVDHMVGVAGEEAVALGMDFDGMEDARVVGLEDVSKLPNISQGLLERGYSPEAIGKILGGNYVRVFSQVLA